jgi:hypothetical protein
MRRSGTFAAIVRNDRSELRYTSLTLDRQALLSGIHDVRSDGIAGSLERVHAVDRIVLDRSFRQRGRCERDQERYYEQTGRLAG